MALVGPMPPTRSGIADYNYRLVEASCQSLEIVVFDPTLDLGAMAGCDAPVPVLPARALGTVEDPARFDAIVYTFGNNEHHHASYDLLRAIGGWVWLHDVRMTGMHLSYSWSMKAEQRAAHVRSLLEAQYGAPLPEHLRDPTQWTVEHFDDHDVFMAHELVARARGVIVNSEHAATLLEHDVGAALKHRSHRVPFAIPHVSVSSPSKPARNVVVPGFVTPTKLPELLVKAFARLGTGGELVFLGDAPDELRVRLEALAAHLGIADRMRITGYVSDGDYAMELGSAGASVLVRASTQGESSAAAMDCLARGIPTVTNVTSVQDVETDLVTMLTGTPTVETLAISMQSALQTPVNADEGERLQEAYSFASVAAALIEVVA